MENWGDQSVTRPRFKIDFQFRFVSIGLYRENALQSRVRLETHLVNMCTTSQCKLRSTFRNLRARNVIFIVT